MVMSVGVEKVRWERSGGDRKKFIVPDCVGLWINFRP